MADRLGSAKTPTGAQWFSVPHRVKALLAAGRTCPGVRSSAPEGAIVEMEEHYSAQWTQVPGLSKVQRLDLLATEILRLDRLSRLGFSGPFSNRRDYLSDHQWGYRMRKEVACDPHSLDAIAFIARSEHQAWSRAYVERKWDTWGDMISVRHPVRAREAG